MLSTVVGALLPIVITLALGYLAGWHHDFSGENAATLNRMVMLYALPLSLFVGMVTTSRDELLHSGWLALAIAGTMIVSFYVTLFFFWKMMGKDVGTASLYGLAVGGPAVPFVGTSVLGYLFGTASTIPISVASLTMNIVQVPTCLILLGVTAHAAGKSTNPGPTNQDSQIKQLGDHLKDAAREPVVWAPILGLLLALIGLHIPDSLSSGLNLLGHTTGGVALFASGVVLFAQKVLMNRDIALLVVLRNLVVPAILWGLLLVTGMKEEAMRQAVVTISIPAASIIVILAVRYRTAEREMASTLFYSTLLSVITMAGFIAFTN